MRFRFWNARILISLFAISGFAAAASAQNFGDRSEAEFALLGPRMESGLRWVIERNRDERYCSLTKDEIRQKLRKSSSAVVAAAFEILREARVRCEARKLGIEQDYYGFHVSLGVGGSFDLDAKTTTNNIGSNGVYDPVDLARVASLNSSKVIGQFGIGYDWRVSQLQPRAYGPEGKLPTVYFIGVNFDVLFGGSGKTIQGIPGIVPFVPAGVATMDTLKFRNDVSLDFTVRAGTYLTPKTAVYGLGGITVSALTLKYDCSAAGFCGFGGATPPFSSETTKWATGGVIGAGIETKVNLLGNAATSLYLEYRAHLLQPVDIGVGSINTRSTSQEVDMSYQSVLGGARISF